jgi:hypothetical protein
MSDTMSSQGAETLLPTSRKAVMGEETITVKTFALAKTIRAFALIGELVESANLGEIMRAVDASEAGGEFEQDIAPSFVTRVVAVLPSALRNGTPAVYKLLGLIATPNSKLRAMDENDEDIDAHLFSEGRRLAYDATTEEAINLLMVAIEAIGVQTILDQLPKVMGLFNR